MRQRKSERLLGQSCRVAIVLIVASASVFDL
jgi:hypothetical protein